MRKIYLWSISLFTAFVGAQERYEAFGVNNKYGIVDIQNQKEYVTPDYSDINLLVTDYLALQNGNQVSFIPEKPEKNSIRQSKMAEYLFE